ncbi:hypothetical protein Dimus_011479 [Dionaea muscipula]
MRQRNRTSPAESAAAGAAETSGESSTKKVEETELAQLRFMRPNRSAYVMLSLFGVIFYGSWGVYRYQYDNLPTPLTAEHAGKRGFSEIEALKHVKTLSGLGPHPVGSDALDLGLQYVAIAAEKIKNTSHWEVDVEVDHFHVVTGANMLHRGLFVGKSLVYADITHIVLRLSPKYSSEARENAILVSSHIDTVSTTGGAGDCSSCVAVMLELARGISQWAHGFKNSIIFLFNTGEEEGLNGAHSFMTQHPWTGTIRMAIDLEAMGVGGKSGIFQAGPHPWAIENFAMVAKYPTGQIIGQELFSSGVIKSATDFQVYKEVGGLSGLDFAYTDHTAVYHTKNDKLELLKAGSLQHLGENMLAFLLHTASSPVLAKVEELGEQENNAHEQTVYFDILGMYMVVYRQRFANMLHSSVIMQSLLIWAFSLFMGGNRAAISFLLSCLSVITTWIFSLGFSVLAAFTLSSISSSALPYISNPWLVIGLFGSPSFLGALAGQHIGFLILQMYLSHAQSKREQMLSPSVRASLVKLEAERWLFKSGILQWLFILMVGNHYTVGSSYLALVWLASPAFSYGLLEATLSPTRLPKPLKIATLLLALSGPILVSGGSIIRLLESLIGNAVRLDRNPGGTPEYLGNVIVAVIVAAVVCLTLVYLLSYIHLSGAKTSVIIAASALFVLSIAAIWSGIIPSYTEDTARLVNVVHVVDTRGNYSGKQEPISYVSLFSTTPGKLTREVEQMKQGFVCGKCETPDFVTYSVKYGCWSNDDSGSGWSELDIPTLQIIADTILENRITEVSMDTKVSRRWALGINAEEIDDFKLTGDSKELIPLGEKSSADGWHIIQFSGGKNAPSMFNLTLHWGVRNCTDKLDRQRESKHLLKLRTDVDRLTPKVERILKKLPPWCALFGKSTSPFTLSFLAGLSLPVEL